MRIQKTIIFISFLGLLFSQSLGQYIPESINCTLSEYKKLIQKYKAENNAQLELNYLNKTAFLYCNNQIFSKSIICFNQSLEVTKKQENSKKSINFFDLLISTNKCLKNAEITDIKQKLTKQSEKLKNPKDFLAEIEARRREQRMLLELKKLKISEQELQKKFKYLVKTNLIGGFIIILIFLLTLMGFYRKIRIQRNQIRQQRDILDLQNKKINSNIKYAQNIQKAILPSVDQLDKFFESFIIFRPKDIISGDFYWYAEMNSTIYIAVIDFSVNGVSGAFMSMIGNRLFNEIVLLNKISDPAKILTLLNERIIEELIQKNKDNNDGMDVCLISVSNKHNKKKLSFSGAKRPLLIYKNKKANFIEIKGDRHSIGGYKNSKEIKDFKNYEIDIELNDIIYLSSDGLINQNNEKRKRFGSHKLKQIISDHISEPLSEQKKVIEKELDRFQGSAKQRDDITLIGLKIIL